MHKSPWIHLLLVALLPGCAFFFGQTPPDDDGAPAARLECEGSFDVTNLGSGDVVPVRVDVGRSLRITTSFAEGFLDSAGILIFDDGQSARNHGEFWDSRTGERTLTGSRRNDEDAMVRIFVPGGGTTAGRLDMSCSSPGEQCNNLTDDDGDGAIDCADSDCARSSGCVEAQENLEELSFRCEDGEDGALPIPELDRFSDQRTLYLSRPGGEDQPAAEFWGGAEVVLLLGAGSPLSSLQIDFGSAGFACSGLALDGAVECAESWRVEPGESLSFAPEQLPIWLEPLDSSWASLSANAACTD